MFQQITNRMLEAYSWHTVIITGTEWENFFALRASPYAEPSMQHLAYMMLEAYNASQPKGLKAGEWHIPYGDKMNYEELGKVTSSYYKDHPNEEVEIDKWRIMIATARCARVSYTVVGETVEHSYEDDIALHNKLSTTGHWSPFEHCAKAMTIEKYNEGEIESQMGWCGNFRGFIQYRKTFNNENKSDERVTKRTAHI